MIVPGTHTRLPCGRCETWVEETAGDRAFMVKTTHGRPESCEWYRWIREEMKRQGKPTVVVDMREGGYIGAS